MRTSTCICVMLFVSSCKDSAGYHGGGQSEEKCKESNSWNAKGEGGREQGRQGAENRSVDRLVLAVSVFVVGARPFDRPETILLKTYISCAFPSQRCTNNVSMSQNLICTSNV